MSATKTCPKCKVDQLYEFFHRKSGSKDGMQSWCHECTRESVLVWQRKNPRKALLHNAKGRAKKAGLPFELTVHVLNWPSHCPVLGIPLIYGGERGRQHAQSASLDRVIPHLGYTATNVRVISWRANSIKGDAEAYELYKVAEYAAKCEEEGD